MSTPEPILSLPSGTDLMDLPLRLILQAAYWLDKMVTATWEAAYNAASTMTDLLQAQAESVSNTLLAVCDLLII